MVIFHPPSAVAVPFGLNGMGIIKTQYPVIVPVVVCEAVFDAVRPLARCLDLTHLEFRSRTVLKYHALTVQVEQHAQSLVLSHRPSILTYHLMTRCTPAGKPCNCYLRLSRDACYEGKSFYSDPKYLQ